MGARRPTILIVDEAQSRADLELPLFQDYIRHGVLSAHGKTGAGLEVYILAGTTTRASLTWGKEDANALLMEVPTRGGSITCWRTMPPKSTWVLSHMFGGVRASGGKSPASWTRRPSWW